jgi:hypothetical protein
MPLHYDVYLPITELVDHLMAGRRLTSSLGSTSIEHIAPLSRYMQPRITPQQAAEIESTFLLRFDSVGHTRDGRGPVKVYYSAHDAVWAFLRAVNGNTVINVEEVPTEETDELTFMAMKEGLLGVCRLRPSETL